MHHTIEDLTRHAIAVQSDVHMAASRLARLR